MDVIELNRLDFELNKNKFQLKITPFPAYGSVYLARKNGGLDDGTLYALKALNIPNTIQCEESLRQDDDPFEIDLLNSEREVNNQTHFILFRIFLNDSIFIVGARKG